MLERPGPQAGPIADGPIAVLAAKVLWLACKASLLMVWLCLPMVIAYMAAYGAMHADDASRDGVLVRAGVFLGVGLLGWVWLTFRLLRRWLRRYRTLFASRGKVISPEA